MKNLLEIAQRYSFRYAVGDPAYPGVPFLPIVISWAGGPTELCGVKLEINTEDPMAPDDIGGFLNWSDEGSTAPVLYFPAFWDGSKFDFCPVDPSEPEGDMGPCVTDGEAAGTCRVATEEEMERLAGSYETIELS